MKTLIDFVYFYILLTFYTDAGRIETYTCIHVYFYRPKVFKTIEVINIMQCSYFSSVPRKTMNKIVNNGNARRRLNDQKPPLDAPVNTIQRPYSNL